jgi:ABC-2 type transport system ATP-binding protein
MEDLLRLFELSEWGNELVEGYSHGMRQRLVFCGAFLHRPRVLIVDEPMVGLDPKGARLLKRVLREYASQGNAVFMSTHTLEVAQEVCDRIAIIDGGEIIALGTMDELRARATGGQDLESIFLQLTGGTEEEDVIAVLRD